MYHVNPKTGEFGICHAKSPESCPFGICNHNENLENLQRQQDLLNEEINDYIPDCEDLQVEKIFKNLKQKEVTEVTGWDWSTENTEEISYDIYTYNGKEISSGRNEEEYYDGDYDEEEEITALIIAGEAQDKWITDKVVLDYIQDNFEYLKEYGDVHIGDDDELQYYDYNFKNMDIAECFGNDLLSYKNNDNEIKKRSFHSCTFKNCDFSKLSCDKFEEVVDLTNSVFDNCKFPKKILNINFNDSVFCECDFSNSDIDLTCDSEQQYMLLILKIVIFLVVI